MNGDDDLKDNIITMNYIEYKQNNVSIVELIYDIDMVAICKSGRQAAVEMR
jgi:hypothetical protein